MSALSEDDVVNNYFSRDSLLLIRSYLQFNLLAQEKLLLSANNLSDVARTLPVLNDLNEEQIAFMRRIFCLDTMAKVMVTIEEFAAFCMALSKQNLLEFPKIVIGYSNRDIGNFFQQLPSRTKDYYRKIWEYPEANQLTTDIVEQKLIEKVMDSNVGYLRSLLLLSKEFWDMHKDTYNKFKHGFTVIPSLVQTSGPSPPKGFDSIPIVVDENCPFESLGAVLVGDVPSDRYIRIQGSILDIMRSLLERRLLRLDYEGELFPPRERQIFSERPSYFTEEEVRKVKRIADRIMPPRRKVVGFEAKSVPINLQEDVKWFLSDKWGP